MHKLTNLQTQLKAKDIDALLVTNPYNRRYITQFTGTAGVALVTMSEAYFITDFRYIEQANEQATDFSIVQHHGPIEDELSKLIQKLAIDRLGFEEDHVTYQEYTTFKEKFPSQLVPVNEIIEILRLKKTEEEIAILKEAAQIADDAFEHILHFMKPGVQEIDIANELEFFMRKQGATSSSFDIIVASGDRSALPHGVASSKEIKHGELVTLDFGALYKGYCSDITRTVAIGDVSEELTTIYDTVLEAQKRGVEGIKPKMTGKEADALARDYIKSKGYGQYFGHSTGHGIGLEVHEGPTLSPRSQIVLEKNMVVTVEPGIYVPNVGGCRIEDDIVLTDSGNDRLTFAPKELIYI
ncbi:MAG TPA: aminopeptidase P family protein [Pseudogracilibacillus sp.]|nr:aminopeptidase P family protein [Pseudogracilibacillus sp.]